MATVALFLSFSAAEIRKGGAHMNEVFLERVLASVDRPEHRSAETNHLVCRLRVTHRNRQGQLKHELYTVNAWNRLADWAQKHLKPGVPVLVQGYLTQRADPTAAATEITALRFVILPCADTAPHRFDNG